MSTPEEAKEVLRRWNEEVWSEGKYDVAYEIMSPVVAVHGAGGQVVGTGPDSLLNIVKAWRSGFPDGRMTIGDLIAEHDILGIRNTFHGTHTGDFYGIPPTGRKVAVMSIGLERVIDGQVVEGWGDLDMVGALQQVGGLPLVGPGAASSGRSAEWEDRPSPLPTGASDGDNRAILIRFIDSLTLNEPMDELVDAEAFVDHNPAWGTTDVDSVVKMSGVLRRAIPDLQAKVDLVLADGDKAAARSTFTGTHRGDAIFGAPPSGAQVTWTETGFVRVKRGRITERWVAADTLTLFQQVGLLHSVPTFS